MAQLNQEEYPVDLAELLGWATADRPAPARTLEVGCGDGTVTRKLIGLGYDAVGIDPHAPDGPMFVSTRVEDFAAEPFDVIVASVSLHHVSDLDLTARRLRDLLAPGGRLVIREFDTAEMADPATLRWWFHQQHAWAAVSESEAPPAEFDEFADDWRHFTVDHIIPWATVRGALEAAGLRTVSEEQGPYLFRHRLSEAHRPLELSLIAAGHVKPCGVWWTGDVGPGE